MRSSAVAWQPSQKLTGSRDRGRLGQTTTAVHQPGRDSPLGDEQVGIVVILPRLARALHHPGVAVALGVILVAVGIIGLASHDIAKGWAILIIVVGTINAMRGIPHNDQGRSS